MPVMSELGLTWLKAVLATVSMALLAWELRHPHGVSLKVKRRIALVLSLAALSAYFQLYHIEYEGYFHRWDDFHYYIGSKYAPELGYERLYACTAVADAEAGNEERAARRPMRDLVNDGMLTGQAALEDRQACKTRFSPERWTEFRHDVTWFRNVSGSADWWDRMQTDHGYNPSPVWTATGNFIAMRLPVGVGNFRALALVDIAFMIASLGAFWWAFGWRVAALAAIFWGTQAPAAFNWVGGAFLRLDWLFWSVLSVALLRKQRWFWAGAVLAYASLLRVFPLLLFAGPVVLVVREVAVERRFSHENRRFFAGAATSALVLLAWGARIGGLAAYADFVHHTLMHAASPIANHMSLRTLFSFVPGGDLAKLWDTSLLDPAAPWTAARNARFAALRPGYYASALVLLGLFAWSVWRIRTRWIAVCLSLLVVTTLTDPSCYYYLAWILVAPLARARRSIEIALMGLAAVGQFLLIRHDPFDVSFVKLAALYVGVSALLVIVFARVPGIFRRGPGAGLDSIEAESDPD